MSDTKNNPERRIALFQKKEIRRTIHNNEWWFVVEDAVLALIESRDPKQYIQRMKLRDPELGKGWVQIVRTLLCLCYGLPSYNQFQSWKSRSVLRWAAQRLHHALLKGNNDKKAGNSCRAIQCAVH